MTYKKSCDDTTGVCTVEKDGKITYEGSPEKVAAFKKKKMAEAKKDSDLAKTVAAMPKRLTEETVRVGFINVGLEPMHYKMFIEEMSKVGNYTIVEPSVVTSAFSDKSSNMGYPDGFQSPHQRPAQMLPFELKTFRKARQQGATADVFVMLTTQSYETVGAFKGSSLKKGSVASLDTLKFQVKASSAFNFSPVDYAAVGRSYTKLDAVGYEKGKKTGQATFNANGNTRDFELDREAIQKLVQSLHNNFETKVKAGLPSYAKLVELESKNRIPAATKTLNIKDKEAQDLIQKALAEKLKGYMKKEDSKSDTDK